MVFTLKRASVNLEVKWPSHQSLTTQLLNYSRRTCAQKHGLTTVPTPPMQKPALDRGVIKQNNFDLKFFSFFSFKVQRLQKYVLPNV